MSFLKNKRGSAEAISFIFTTLVLMLVVLNMVPPVQDMMRYFTMTRVHRETMLRMEVAGGLTPEIQDKAREALEDAGLDPAGITIDGTWAVADYGEPIDLNIEYSYTYRQYALSDFLIAPLDDPKQIGVFGSSVSFTFTK